MVRSSKIITKNLRKLLFFADHPSNFSPSSPSSASAHHPAESTESSARPRFCDVDIPEIPVHEDPGEENEPPWHPTWEGEGGRGDDGGGGGGSGSENGAGANVDDHRLRSRSETFPCDPYSAAASASTTVNGAWSSSSSSETAWGHHAHAAATTTWGHAPTPAAIHVPITGSTESAGSGASCSTTR